MAGCMDGVLIRKKVFRMNEEMDGWLVSQMDGKNDATWMDDWLNRQICEWMDNKMFGWLKNGQGVHRLMLYKRLDGSMD